MSPTLSAHDCRCNMSEVPSAESRHGWYAVAGTSFILLMGIGSAFGLFAIGAAADRIGRWRGLGLSFAGVG